MHHMQHASSRPAFGGMALPAGSHCWHHVCTSRVCGVCQRSRKRGPHCDPCAFRPGRETLSASGRHLASHKGRAALQLAPRHIRVPNELTDLTAAFARLAERCEGQGVPLCRLDLCARTDITFRSQGSGCVG